MEEGLAMNSRSTPQQAPPRPASLRLPSATRRGERSAHPANRRRVARGGHCSARSLLCLGLALAHLLTGASLRAGEVQLKNGLVLRGVPVKVETLYTGSRKPKNYSETIGHPILMISTPIKRYFVPRSQQTETLLDVDMSRSEVFALKQPKQSGASRELLSIGGQISPPSPFDEFGRRTLTLAGSPEQLTVIQGITEIGPESIRLAALNYKWETAIPTSSLPTEQLQGVLAKLVDARDLDQRLKVARFFIQAQSFPLAEAELQAIGRDFPEQQSLVETVRTTLVQDRARQILNELKLRQRSGQHRFVYESLQRFPSEGIAPEVVGEARELLGKYDADLERLRRLPDQLLELQTQLPEERRDEVEPLRRTLLSQLSVNTLDRLDAFENLRIDNQLSAAEKLALALSGWVVGSPNATTELGTAVGLWQARALVLDYLRTEPDAAARRAELLQQFGGLEGVSPARVAQLLPLLPDPLDPLETQPGVPNLITLPGQPEDAPIRYTVQLPPEYDPARTYPAIVTLHAEGSTPAQALAFWAGAAGRQGQAARHGYIVIAPHHTEETRHDYSAATQERVLLSLRDACQRFHIDQQRVFLSGHMMGGDAAFELGFAHPDLFAGVIPIAGVSDQICQFYWENARELPFFVILGELDRETVLRNTRELERMMTRKFDVVFAEYVGAGADNFYGEIHVLFDWMSRLQRPLWPRKIEGRSLRVTEKSWYWLEIGGLPTVNRYTPGEGDRRAPPKPLLVTANMVQPANRLDISNATRRTRLRLSPEGGLVDFSKKLQVNVNGRQKFNDFLKPDLEAMLENARILGNRHQICWAVLEL